jgi:hypothetical protein
MGMQKPPNTLGSLLSGGLFLLVVLFPILLLRLAVLVAVEAGLSVMRLWKRPWW